MTKRPTGVTALAIGYWIACIVYTWIATWALYEQKLGGSIFFVFAIICFIAGWGLWGLHRWGRIIAAIVAPFTLSFAGFLAVLYLVAEGDAFQPAHCRPTTARTPTTDKTLDIYTPTLKQLDSVTPVYNIEEVGEYAECPYCGSNIRETFYELGGVVRCNKCGALHHRECFEYYGRKCGSPSCKLREA